MNKGWVQKKGKFRQVDNQHLTFEQAADRNDKLDLKLWQKFGYHKPYLLLTRHHNMEDMSFLQDKERFNEPVIYPQAQDAMFYGESFTAEEAKAKVNLGEWAHRNFNHHIKAWNIKMHHDAKAELSNAERKKKNGEMLKWKLKEYPKDFY
ncbi:hypothetical protein F4859DRAFT_516957 [Xylaria cf. heliscus]|nr:hypothetical protein F4859DRAFT_516957 [Xylaria cf. heliscus]